MRNNNEFSHRILVLQTTTTSNQPPESSTSSLTISSPSGVVITGGTFLNATDQSKRGKPSSILAYWWLFTADQSAILTPVLQCWPTSWSGSNLRRRMISWCGCLDHPVLGNLPLRRKLQSYPLKGVYSLLHFSSRTSSTRNTKDHLNPTLAYQRRSRYFQENHWNFNRYSPYPTSTQTIPLPKLVIIDATNVTIV